jgi:hypothetical protein
LLVLFINQEQTSTQQQKKPLCEVQGTIKRWIFRKAKCC